VVIYIDIAKLAAGR